MKSSSILVLQLTFLARVHHSCAIFGPLPFKSASAALTPSLSSAIPRGGIGGLGLGGLGLEGIHSIVPQDAAAKFLGTYYLLSGAVDFLAPGSALVKWSNDDDLVEQVRSSPTNKKLLRRFGLAIMNVGVITYCTLFKMWNSKVAYVFNSILWTGDALASLLNNESDDIGPSKATDIVTVALNSAVVIAGLNDLSFFHTAATAFSVSALVCSLPCLFVPNSSSSSSRSSSSSSSSSNLLLYNMKNTDELTAGCKTIMAEGFCILGTVATSISLGVAPLTSFAYGTIVGSLFDAKNLFYDKDLAAQFGLDWRKVVWISVMGAFTAASILLSKE